MCAIAGARGFCQAIGLASQVWRILDLPTPRKSKWLMKENVLRCYNTHAQHDERLFLRGLRDEQTLLQCMKALPLLQTPCSVLDLSCGTDAALRAQAKHLRAYLSEDEFERCSFWAVDPTPAMLDRLKEHAHQEPLPHLHCFLESVSECFKTLNFSADSFDRILSSAMLEYLTPDENAAMFEGCARVLRPSGTCVLWTSKDTWLNRWWMQRGWHARMRPQKTLEARLAACFKSVRFERIPWPHPHMNVWGHWVICQRPQL